MKLWQRFLLWCALVWAKRPWRKKPRIINGSKVRVSIRNADGTETVIGLVSNIQYHPVRSEGRDAFTLPERVESFKYLEPTTFTLSGRVVKSEDAEKLRYEAHRLLDEVWEKK